MQPAESRLGFVSIRDDPDDEAPYFTQDEKELIYRMKADKAIYHRLAASIAPTVYGHDEVRKPLLVSSLSLRPIPPANLRSCAGWFVPLLTSPSLCPLSLSRHSSR